MASIPETGTDKQAFFKATCLPADEKRLPTRLCERALCSFVLWAGLVDGQIATVQVFAFESAYRGFAFSSAAHGYKGKSTRFARHAIGDEVHIGHSSILCEQILEIGVSGTKRKISNV
jgi:hypothetical protein